ncbi:FMN-dependent NADH-azoreductase [Rhodococcus sp. 27YEA15]|uniref:FMN-dependent NADH-azoreductase n=1 Tax=Rhodococcus sp. 27YEA15 TaxID=3156259 RepID=UPI003C7BF2C4
MTKVLEVRVSPRGDNSFSSQITSAYVGELAAGGAEVTTWNLFEMNLPEFGTTAADAKMAVFSGAEQTAEQKQVWADCEQLFSTFADFDVYAFGLPLWNAGVPYKFKQLIDIITQPGWSFGFDPEAGYSGLLTSKRAFVALTSGVYKPGQSAAFGSDFAEPFIDDWLRFVGINDITVERFSPTVMTADAQADLAVHVASARAAAASLVGALS